MAFYPGKQVADQCPLTRFDAGIPAIEDQHDAGQVAVVPGFVLDGVVKGEGLALAPVHSVATDPKATLRRHDQPELGAPRIGGVVTRLHGVLDKVREQARG